MPQVPTDTTHAHTVDAIGHSVVLHDKGRGQLVDEAEPADELRAKIAGESAQRAALIALVDVIEIATDTMNDGSGLGEGQSAAANALVDRIESVLASDEQVAEVQDQALVQTKEWLADSGLDDSTAEALREVRNAIINTRVQAVSATGAPVPC